MDSLLARLVGLSFRPVVLVHVLGLGVTGTLLYVARRRLPRTPAVRVFLLAVSATFLWTFFEAAQVMASPSSRGIWLFLQSFGFGAAGPLWFVFGDRSVRRPWVRTRLDVLLLWGIAIGTVLVVATNFTHGLFLDWTGRPGPALWMVLAVQVGLVVVSQGRILVDGWQTRSRALEATLVVVGTLVPGALLVVSQMGALSTYLSGPSASLFALAQFGILKARLPRLGTSLGLDVLLDTMDAGVASLLPDGSLLETNRWLRERLGSNAPAPTRLEEVFEALGLDPEEATRLRQDALREARRITGRDARGRWLEVSLHPVHRGSVVAGLLLQVRDISPLVQVTEQLKAREQELEQARAELEAANARLQARARELEAAVAEKARRIEEQHEQLLHAQKMESLGTLAGGIAHDFNNVLFSVIGYADLILQSPGDQDEVVYCAEKIRQGAQRATELTKKLLGFARRDKPRKQPMDLAALVRDVVTVLRRTVEPRIQFRQELPSEPAMVLADPQQLHQVLMNLCLNAAEAISGVGRVTIRLRLVQGPDGRAEHELQVEDTGCGMTEEVRARIFEPFFTTKSRGKGTGLGLSLVYGIVQEHGGRIEVESAPGRGTLFRVFLPVLEETGGVQEEARRPRRASSGYRKSRKTFDHLALEQHRVGILVVDDNQEVLALTKRYFAEPLFQVWTAGTSLEAEQILRDFPGAVDVILLDLVLPDASARDVFLRLRELAPEVPVVLMSGYHSEDLVSELLDLGATHYLRKPFGRQDIRRVVRTVLEE